MQAVGEQLEVRISALFHVGSLVLAELESYFGRQLAADLVRCELWREGRSDASKEVVDDGREAVLMPVEGAPDLIVECLPFDDRLGRF